MTNIVVSVLTTVFWFILGWVGNNLSRARRDGAADDKGGEQK
jgi:hypothetical protein